MSDAATFGDPVRAQVEATLRRVAADVTALPCQLVRFARRRVEQPVAVVRTVVTLAVNTVVGESPLAGRAAPSDAAVTAPPPLTGRAYTAASPWRDNPSADLPIDDYDNLAASQVVARLDRLDADDLGVIEAFESANRGRRTILGKIEQLRSAR